MMFWALYMVGMAGVMLGAYLASGSIVSLFMGLLATVIGAVDWVRYWKTQDD